MKKSIYPILCTLLIMFAGTSILQGQTATAVEDWGFIGGRVAGWGITLGDPGDVTLSGEESMTTGWSAIRGEFADVTPGAGEAIIVTGQIQTVGQDLSQWNAIRYGIFRHDSLGTLEHAGTDSARFPGPEGFSYGYLLMTMSGTNDRANFGWHGTSGDIGSLNGGVWLSTNSEGTYSLGQRDQRLFRAVAPAGLYDFAISVHTMEDGNNQLRYYLIHEDGEYWWGGIVVDTTGVPTDSYNGVIFGLNADMNDMTAVHFHNISVNIGAPVAIPDPPLETPPHDVGRILNENRNFELADFGDAVAPFWTLAKGNTLAYDIVGDDAQNGDRSLMIQFADAQAGNPWEIEAVNEPFYPAAGDSIRATIWLKADSDDRVATLYLGLPEACNWGRPASANVTLTTEWAMYSIADYEVTANDEDCTMRFAAELNVAANVGGTIWMDNAIVRKFAQGPVTSVEPPVGIAYEFGLDQNYPNPFNPTTQIRFTLPDQSNVLLEVYDILGRRVATLVNNENYSMGHHTVTWNATNQAGLSVSSGIYIYRLKAGSQVETKRMMFLK
jgi:hypothetical protein